MTCDAGRKGESLGFVVGLGKTNLEFVETRER